MRKLKIYGFTKSDSEMGKLMEMVNFKESQVEKEVLDIFHKYHVRVNNDPPKYTDNMTLKPWREFVSKCSIDEQFFATFTSLKKKDENKELIVYAPSQIYMNIPTETIIAFVDKKKADKDLLSKENWVKPFNFSPQIHKFHDNIYVPYTKKGIWEYIAISAFTCYIADTEKHFGHTIPIVYSPWGLLHIFENTDVVFMHNQFRIEHYAPFVYLDDDKESAYVGYTSWSTIYGVIYTLWKLKWKDGCIVERTLAFRRTLVYFDGYDMKF